MGNTKHEAPAADFGRLKGIIFDYGGTLDTRGTHWSHVIYEMYGREGLEIPYDSFRDAYVEAERELARTRHILPHHNFLDLMRIKIRIEFDWLVARGLMTKEVAEAKADAVARDCYDFARSCIEEVKPSLETLAAEYPMVLVSNFYGNVETVLLDFGIRRYFGEIVESSVVGIRKPDPAIFALGVKALGLKPEEVLVVGDSLRKDILPAESIGCMTAWIKGPGWTADEDALEHPSQVESLEKLAKAILRNLNK